MLKSSSTCSASLRVIKLTIHSASTLVISIKIVKLFELFKIRKLVYGKIIISYWVCYFYDLVNGSYIFIKCKLAKQMKIFPLY